MLNKVKGTNLHICKSVKWMEIIKRFSNTGDTGRCQECGHDLEAIIENEHLDTVVFYCENCDTAIEYSGRRIC